MNVLKIRQIPEWWDRREEILFFKTCFLLSQFRYCQRKKLLQQTLCACSESVVIHRHSFFFVITISYLLATLRKLNYFLSWNTPPVTNKNYYTFQKNSPLSYETKKNYKTLHVRYALNFIFLPGLDFFHSIPYSSNTTVNKILSRIRGIFPQSFLYNF